MQKPYIIYSLSKDRTTQKFRKNKFHEILEDVDSFLRVCTTSNVDNLNSLILTVFENNPDSAIFFSKALGSAQEQFGVYEKSPIAFNYPSGKPDSRNKYVWTLSAVRLQEVLKFINSNSPMPKLDFGPIKVFFSFDFKLLDLDTNSELADQEHTSSFCIWFSRSKSISPTIFFPFGSANESFWNYLDKIADILPFKLEEKYLRIANVNLKGEVKYFKKISR